MISLMSRKSLAIYVMTLYLCSCSSLNSSNIAPNFQTAYIAAKNAIFGYPDIEIDSARIETIPYASMLIRIGKGPQGLLILESLNNEKETWVSADLVYIVIKRGKIIRTLGLVNNLTEVQSSFNSLKDFVKKGKESDEYYSYYSYDEPKLVDMRVLIKLKNLGLQKVQLLSGEQNLFCIEEMVKNQYLGWEVINKYWIDEQGYVLKSIQNISPKLPEISFEVTKKPAI